MNTKTLLGASLGVIFAFAMITNPAFAAVLDPKGDSLGNADQDLKSWGLDDDGNPSAKVWGQAGQTLPAEGYINAYVLVTDDGIYAVTSHVAEDSSEVGDDLEWHAHKITLNGSNCITSIAEDGDAWVHGNQVAVLNTAATTVDAALIVSVNGGTGCVSTVFDAPDA